MLSFGKLGLISQLAPTRSQSNGSSGSLEYSAIFGAKVGSSEKNTGQKFGTE